MFCFILFIYSILLSNYFILFLFNIYKFSLNCINILNSIKFEPLTIKNINSSYLSVYRIKKKNNKTYYYQVKSFSTYSKNNYYTEIPVLDPEFVKESQEKLAALDEKELKEFKKAYGGGYLGYNHIHNFGNVSQFYQFSTHLLHFIDNLILKLKDYVNEIPENVTYSVLPVLRWQYSNGEYRSLTITSSIKINREIYLNLLAEKLLWDISETLIKYDLRDADLELFLMGRPWLSIEDFNLDNIDKFIDRKRLANLFEYEIEKKLAYFSESSIQLKKTFQIKY